MTTLRQGDKSAEVRELQDALNRAGAALEVDGVYGPATFTAVKAFQCKHDLQTDGVCGPITWAALKPYIFDYTFVREAIEAALDAVAALPEVKALEALLEWEQ